MAVAPITLEIGRSASKEHQKKLKTIVLPHAKATATITLPIPLNMNDPCPVESILLLDAATPVFKTFDIKVADGAGTGCQQNDLGGAVTALYFQVTDAVTLTFNAADNLTANGFAHITANFEQ